MICKKKKKNHTEVVEVRFETSPVYFKVHSLIYCTLLISLRFLGIHFIIPINISVEETKKRIRF